MTLRLALATLLALTLAACATSPSPPLGATPAAPSGPPALPPLRPIALADLPGWRDEDHAAAFAAYRATCATARDASPARLCSEARGAGPLDGPAARAFFEARFEALPLPGTGVLTGYYAPVYEARSQPDAVFSAPVRPRPADLAAGAPYADRAAIESQPAPNALAWMKPEDLFFLQVQGSGVLILEDGRRVKALYAANNGQPFVALAAPMRERGLLPPDGVSAQAIHDWLAYHRGPEAQALMALNPRYAFFSLAPDDGRPPVGAAAVPLPAGRAVAVDPAYHAYGGLLWVEAASPVLSGAFPRYRRLVTALDTGGAIRGPIRADLYLGEGDAAGVEAGRIRHTLRLWRLVPKGRP